MTPQPGDGDSQPGGSNGTRSGEFDAFLAEIAGAVAERVQALGSRKISQPDPIFFDATKTIIEWPEISAYVIEELR